MIKELLIRGLIAGALAGLLAGLVGVVVGEPAIDAAIAIEEAAAADAPAPSMAMADDDAAEVTRPQQKVGLVVGSMLLGVAVGAAYAMAAAWAVGRVRGDAWQRSVKLGAVAVAAAVLLPALKYAPNPPAVGDPTTVGTRSTLYLGLIVLGLLLAGAAWSTLRRLAEAGTPPHIRQAAVGTGVVVVVGVLLWLLPDTAGAGDFPADLLWDFRLAAVATQATLHAGTATIFGVLSMRADETTPQATDTLTTSVA